MSMNMRYVVPKNVNKHATVPRRLVNDVDSITSLLLQCIMMTIFLILNPFGIRPRMISSNPFLTVQSIDLDWKIDWTSIRTKICCCDRLWFHQSMTLQSKSKLQTVKLPVIDQIFPSKTDEEEFCSTCMSRIRGSNVPPLAVCHGFNYPE
ncbi:hypothetical protein CDAR_527511 [Caerostris darwini]|uniref:Uncharacterized protein n=1 Tax=Caerostris darwini TaxID=1538125 RepID=A0AAV4R9W8_9ARAC|nr:hypothetical protein CDAR_527511 [Caerostris darwini]